MVGKETIRSAKEWCQTGVRWVDSGAVRLGLSYLERSAAVFAEIEEVPWLTYTRHYILVSLRRSGRDDEVENMFEDVMWGYSQMDQPEGTVVLLADLAQSMFSKGRKERALSQLNLALSIAHEKQLERLTPYLLNLKGQIYSSKDNPLMALRLFREAEETADEAGMTLETLGFRLMAAKTLETLGETSEAIATLEDLQIRLMRARRYRNAVEVLKRLVDLYGRTSMVEEKRRVTDLIYFCGQNVIEEKDDITALDTPRPPTPGVSAA